MGQSVQFARRMPTIPSALSTRPVRARQLDFSRPVSRSGSIGFAVLSLGLAAMTFVVTIWGLDLPTELQIVDQLKLDATSVISRTPVSLPVATAQVEVIFEPKTLGRLPVFGGMTPNHR